MKRLDIVVFGATGYTGKFLVRELATSFASQNVSWGIAGRSLQKLTEVLNQISIEKGFLYSKLDQGF